MEHITYRRAGEDEVPGLIALQSEVFLSEQGIPADDPARFMARRPIFWYALAGEEVCGTAAAWREGETVHWGRFAVLPPFRRRGIGAGLARFSFEDLFAGGAEEIYMEARDATAAMAEAMGGRRQGPPVLFCGANVTPVILRREDYRPG